MAMKKISIEVEEKDYEKVLSKFPLEKVTTHLKNCVIKLGDNRLKGPGVTLKCPACDHEWLYKGVEWRTGCNRCGTKIRTGVRPYRNPDTGRIEWRLKE